MPKRNHTSYTPCKGLRIFKPCYRNRDGELVPTLNWWFEFRDVEKRPRRLPGFPDATMTEDLGRQVLRLVGAKISGGQAPDTDLQRWIEGMPNDLRGRLAKIGLLSGQRVAAGKPLVEHLADWKAALAAKGNTPDYVELKTGRASAAFAACGFRLWGEIAASKLQAHLADLRVDSKAADGTIRRGISNQTFNFYLQACQQFARWMMHDGRASESPLTHLQGLNVKTDRRHDRRAMSPDELRWLLDVTENGYSKPGDDGKPVVIVAAAERFGMTPEARARVYRLAAESGLRSNEIRSLSRASFALAGDEPSVTVGAAYSKRRREDTLPLRHDTAALLLAHLAGKMPAAKAFNMPGKSQVVKMLRADLAEARRAWLESHRTQQEREEAAKGTFLCYADDAGRVADFQCLRHSFISNLAAGGVHPKTAQTLARHSTITLTMDRYTHSYRGEAAAALDVLPDLSTTATTTAQTLAATGTDGKSDESTNLVLHEAVLPLRLALLDAKNGSERAQDGQSIATPVDAATQANHAEIPGKTVVLTAPAASDMISGPPRRGGRVAEGDGLLNRCTALSCTGGSNPPLSVFRKTLLHPLL